MVRVIGYAVVMERMGAEGLECLYHNSGAFGFGKGVPTWTAGWVGPGDESIRVEMRGMVRRVAPPFERNLAGLALRGWRELLAGVVWVMPKSHWSYELEFGNREWMPGVIERLGVDPNKLVSINNATAIEFEIQDGAMFAGFVEELLEKLSGSDFAMVFPGWGTICTVHSHKQLWWTTADAGVAEGLERIVSEFYGKQ